MTSHPRNHEILKYIGHFHANITELVDKTLPSHSLIQSFSLFKCEK